MNVKKLKNVMEPRDSVEAEDFPAKALNEHVEDEEEGAVSSEQSRLAVK